jgi:hypothetical protein
VVRRWHPHQSFPQLSGQPWGGVPDEAAHVQLRQHLANHRQVGHTWRSGQDRLVKGAIRRQLQPYQPPRQRVPAEPDAAAANASGAAQVQGLRLLQLQGQTDQVQLATTVNC